MLASRILSLILILPLSSVLTINSLIYQCNASSAAHLPKRPNIIASMTSKMAPLNEASALRELKETIARQANEIKELKSALHESKSSSLTRQQASTSAHHHVPSSTESPNEYISTPFYTLAFRRVSWLAIFIFALLGTAIIINGYEHILSKQIELAYFVPLLAGHGGNTGGQTVGAVLSALSTKSITTSDSYKIIAKEARSGLTVGCILGLVVGTLAHIIGGVSTHVSVVVGCTLPVTSCIAGILASGIPFMCVKFGVDPAVIAAPAMTTFVDLSGLVAYFFIAERVFRWFQLEL